ncbi:MAG: transglutaminase-like cysteine peptidase [Azoarcus sp.]|nr:transglutaminase-like cysteine peptidase [Azoarcus sp.]
MWLRRLFAVLCIGIAGWANAATDFDRMEQLAEERYGEIAVATVKAWRTLIDQAKPLSERDKLEKANTFVNRHAFYESDLIVWGQVDYWATPLELFGKQAGDCEDFAIAKYITLRLLNVPLNKLRLVYARAQLGGSDSTRTQAHMVLSYYEKPTSEPLILDILVSDILPARKRPDLLPVFSFNHDGLWMEGERKSSSNPRTRLSRWRDMLRRMSEEGIDPSLAALTRQSILSWVRAKPNPSASLFQVAQFKGDSPTKKTARSQHGAKKMKAVAKAKPQAKKRMKKVAKSRPAKRKVAKR